MLHISSPHYRKTQAQCLETQTLNIRQCRPLRPPTRSTRNLYHSKPVVVIGVPNNGLDASRKSGPVASSQKLCRAEAKPTWHDQSPTSSELTMAVSLMANAVRSLEADLITLLGSCYHLYAVPVCRDLIMRTLINRYTQTHRSSCR